MIESLIRGAVSGREISNLQDRKTVAEALSTTQLYGPARSATL